LRGFHGRITETVFGGKKAHKKGEVGSQRGRGEGTELNLERITYHRGVHV